MVGVYTRSAVEDMLLVSHVLFYEACHNGCPVEPQLLVHYNSVDSLRAYLVKTSNCHASCDESNEDFIVDAMSASGRTHE